MSKTRCFMHFKMVSILVFVLLAGCTNRTDKRLVGTWQIADAESISQRVGADEHSDPPNMTIDFASSGLLTTSTKMGSIDSSKQGTWKITDSEESKNLLTIQCVLQTQTTEHEIQFLSDDLIEWIPPNMAGTTRKIRFERNN